MPYTAAVINSNEDVVEMLRSAMELAGLNTVTAHIADIKRGTTDFLTLLRKAAGADIEVFEISEKPYDLEVLVQSVRRQLGIEAA
jgi:hypothetical protein